MTEPLKNPPTPPEPDNDASTKPIKARSSRKLIGLFRPSDEVLASDAEFEKWAEQVAEYIMREVARTRAALDKESDE